MTRALRHCEFPCLIAINDEEWSQSTNIRPLAQPWASHSTSGQARSPAATSVGSCPAGAAGSAMVAGGPSASAASRVRVAGA